MKNPNVATKCCIVCGDVFSKKPSYSVSYWKVRKYCSRKCSLTKTSVQMVAENPWKGRSIPTEVRRKMSASLKGRQPNAGSFKIGHKSNTGRSFGKGNKNPNWKSQETSCAHCGKTLVLQPNQLRDRNFCSRECWALGSRGDNSPVYLGAAATKPLRHRVMTMHEYKRWHAAVLQRDDYTCKKCGKRGGGMTVDHIVRYRDIVIACKIKTLDDARKCAALWDITNGQTLCWPCHRTLATFGTKGLKNIKNK